jgi:fumarate reductase flavoprotein subunit
VIKVHFLQSSIRRTAAPFGSLTFRSVHKEDFVELVSDGGVKKAESPAALAACHRLDSAAVTATVEDYNKAARGEQAFGRRDFALAPLAGTLYVCRVIPGLFHTQGGLMVDDDGRVLR